MLPITTYIMPYVIAGIAAISVITLPSPLTNNQIIQIKEANELQIDNNGNWKIYRGNGPIPGEPLGTITRKPGDTGALIKLPNGTYIQGNAGVIRNLPQNKIKQIIDKNNTSERERIIKKLIKIDSNGVWNDIDNINEGYKPLTLQEARKALSDILNRD